MIRPLFFLAVTLSSQLQAFAEDSVPRAWSELTLSGRINDQRIVEASGLARSHVAPDRLWLLNDGGSRPQLFAISTNGEDRGAISLRNSSNVDWEDLASFEYDGKAWLLVADIGDNAAERRFCTLYIVEEPVEAHEQSISPSWTIRFTYPDGPRDAESVAVDVESGDVFVLAKRTVPAELYRVPLFIDSSAQTPIAESLGSIDSIPQPARWDIVSALARNSWHWQPTAMDFSQDGQTVAILTYVGLYIFDRRGSASLIEALQKPPQSVSLDKLELAEAVAFGPDGSLFVTVEGSSPPLYRAVRSSDD